MLAFAFLAAAMAEIWPIGRTAARYEVRFLKGLMEQRLFASRLASLGVSRATHPELQTLCSYKSWALTSEVADHRRLLGEWYGIDHEPQVTPRGERTIKRLSALAGEEFETQFMEEMIKLNTSALRLGRQCGIRCMHSQLPPMWLSMGEGLESETAQFREWLCAWYSHCRGTQ